MIYWDSSAAVAVFLNEKAAIKIDGLPNFVKLQRIYSAVITPLEIESALLRRLAEKSITLREADASRSAAAEFRRKCFLVITDLNVLDIALNYQKVYGLRPADSIQLASARVGTENPSQTHFLCLDRQLNQAATREGFTVPF